MKALAAPVVAKVGIVLKTCFFFVGFKVLRFQSVLVVVFVLCRVVSY